MNKLSPTRARKIAGMRKTKTGGRRGRIPGAVSDKPRCACGANTQARAAARGFDCCKRAGVIRG